MNPFERAARSEKALRLVAAIDRGLEADGLYLTLHEAATANARMPHALREMTEQWWAQIAERAGVRPPSEKTIAAVVEIFEARVVAGRRAS